MKHPKFDQVCVTFIFHNSTDVERVVEEMSEKEPLITPSKMTQVRKLVVRLQEKLMQIDDQRFFLFKVSA